MPNIINLATEQKQDAIQIAVDDVKTTVNTVNTNVDSVKTDVSTVNTNVNSVKTTVSTVNTNVGSVLSKINSLLSSSLSSAIKSVQRGNVFTNSVSNIPISYVNPNKCIVILNGGGDYMDGQSNGVTPTVYCSLLTSTNLEISKTAKGAVYFSWQVIEFY